jgi:hypothetical protein
VGGTLGNNRRVVKELALVGGNPGIVCADIALAPKLKNMTEIRSKRIGRISRTGK